VRIGPGTISLQFFLRPRSLLFRQAALRDPQVFVWVKTLFVAMAVIFKVALPVLVRVAVCALLTVLTN
jgi:hypothetical protein